MKKNGGRGGQKFAFPSGASGLLFCVFVYSSFSPSCVLTLSLRYTAMLMNASSSSLLDSSSSSLEEEEERGSFGLRKNGTMLDEEEEEEEMERRADRFDPER